MTSARFAGALGLFAAFAAAGIGGGCANGDGARGSEGKVGSATLAVIDVPDGVSCIEVDAAGSTTVQTFVDVTPGQPADIAMSELPVGVVAFSAEAFPTACDEVTPSDIPTWLSDTEYATLEPGVTVDISLTLHENGVADVGVGFESSAGCHQAGQPCLAGSDCCTGICSDNACVGSCSADGDACSAGPDCCSGQCESGACVPASGGGTSGSACDHSGTCGDAGSGCVACALSTDCAAASDACLGGADCLAFLDCAGSCLDQACYDGCTASHAEGAAAYNALLACVYCDACPADCDPASLGVACP